MSFQTRLVDKILIKRGIWGGRKQIWKQNKLERKTKKKYLFQKELGTFLLVAEAGIEPTTSGL